MLLFDALEDRLFFFGSILMRDFTTHCKELKNPPKKVELSHA